MKIAPNSESQHGFTSASGFSLDFNAESLGAGGLPDAPLGLGLSASAPVLLASAAAASFGADAITVRMGSQSYHMVFGPGGAAVMDGAGQRVAGETASAVAKAALDKVPGFLADVVKLGGSLGFATVTAWLSEQSPAGPAGETSPSANWRIPDALVAAFPNDLVKETDPQTGATLGVRNKWSGIEVVGLRPGQGFAPNRNLETDMSFIPMSRDGFIGRPPQAYAQPGHSFAPGAIRLPAAPAQPQASAQAPSPATVLSPPAPDADQIAARMASGFPSGIQPAARAAILRLTGGEPAAMARLAADPQAGRQIYDAMALRDTSGHLAWPVINDLVTRTVGASPALAVNPQASLYQRAFRDWLGGMAAKGEISTAGEAEQRLARLQTSPQTFANEITGRVKTYLASQTSEPDDAPPQPQPAPEGTTPEAGAPSDDGFAEPSAPTDLPDFDATPAGSLAPRPTPGSPNPTPTPSPTSSREIDVTKGIQGGMPHIPQLEPPATPPPSAPYTGTNRTSQTDGDENTPEKRLRLGETETKVAYAYANYGTSTQDLMQATGLKSKAVHEAIKHLFLITGIKEDDRKSLAEHLRSHGFKTQEYGLKTSWGLSPRELSVASAIAEGLTSNADISRLLNIPESSVNISVQNIVKKISTGSITRPQLREKLREFGFSSKHISVDQKFGLLNRQSTLARAIANGSTDTGSIAQAIGGDAYHLPTAIQQLQKKLRYEGDPNDRNEFRNFLREIGFATRELTAAETFSLKKNEQAVAQALLEGLSSNADISRATGTVPHYVPVVIQRICEKTGIDPATPRAQLASELQRKGFKN